MQFQYPSDALGGRVMTVKAIALTWKSRLRA